MERNKLGYKREIEAVYVFIAELNLLQDKLRKYHLVSSEAREYEVFSLYSRELEKSYKWK